MKTVTKDTLLALLDKLSSTGTFFTVWFIKKDGTERKLTGRFGVVKHLHGGKSTLPPEKFYTVFDMSKQDYRAVSKDTVFRVKTGGEIYEVVS